MNLRELISLDEKVFYQKLSKKIRDARIAKGLTQKELAANLNLSNNYISKIENTDRFPNLFITLKILNYLEISFEEIISYISRPIGKEEVLKNKRIHKINESLTQLSIDELDAFITILDSMGETKK